MYVHSLYGLCLFVDVVFPVCTCFIIIITSTQAVTIFVQFNDNVIIYCIYNVHTYGLCIQSIMNTLHHTYVMAQQWKRYKPMKHQIAHTHTHPKNEH